MDYEPLWGWYRRTGKPVLDSPRQMEDDNLSKTQLIAIALQKSREQKIKLPYFAKMEAYQIKEFINSVYYYLTFSD